VVAADGGDFAVFVTTGYDVEWLLSTALERLYLQVWPLVVCGVFLTVEAAGGLRRCRSPVEAPGEDIPATPAQVADIRAQRDPW
jgi:hypothetical protein